MKKKIKKESKGCIYYIVNSTNGKGYIGQHSTLKVKKRWRGHLVVARRGSKYPLYCALRKYPISVFSLEVVWRGPTFLLNEKEEYYIEKFQTCVDDGSGYNLTYGGEGGVPSDRVRRKRNNAIKAAWVDSTKCVEHGKKLSVVFSTPEQKEQRSRQRKIDWRSPSYREKMLKRKGMLGLNHTAETCARISEAAKQQYAAMTSEAWRVFSKIRSEASKLGWKRKSEESRKAFGLTQKTAWARRRRKSTTNA